MDLPISFDYSLIKDEAVVSEDTYGPTVCRLNNFSDSVSQDITSIAPNLVVDLPISFDYSLIKDGAVVSEDTYSPTVCHLNNYSDYGMPTALDYGYASSHVL